MGVAVTPSLDEFAGAARSFLQESGADRSIQRTTSTKSRYALFSGSTRVDLLMALELARSSLDVAVAAADGYLAEPGQRTAEQLSIAASAAKARCGDAAMLVADQSLHILGGIGFTWEHDAHLYFRRAKTLEVLLGTPSAHRRRFATILLEAAASA